MPVYLNAPQADQLLPIAGLRIGVVQAGIRKAGRKNVTVLLLDEGASVGGAFTQNRFCAAPVQVCREHLPPRHAAGPPPGELAARGGGDAHLSLTGPGRQDCMVLVLR